MSSSLKFASNWNSHICSNQLTKSVCRTVENTINAKISFYCADGEDLKILLIDFLSNIGDVIFESILNVDVRCTCYYLMII